MYDTVLYISRGVLIGMCMGGIVLTIWWVWLEIKGLIDESKRSKGP